MTILTEVSSVPSITSDSKSSSSARLTYWSQHPARNIIVVGGGDFSFAAKTVLFSL